jgi:SAM-dependent methyltransferase
VEEAVTDWWASVARTPTRRWSVWKYHWIVNHRILDALERTRGYARGVLLDIGCGDPRMFARPFEGRIERYVGVDLPSSAFAFRPHAFARGERLPFRDGSIGTVLSLSVINYVPDPALVLADARRVLAPGGHLLIEFPQMVALESEPHDYFRFTRHAARLLLERAGFEVIEVLPIGSLWTAVALHLMASLNRINRGPLRVLTELPVRALYVVIGLFFDALERLIPARRWPLAHLVVARAVPTRAPLDRPHA